jgi:hypothetical protein
LLSLAIGLALGGLPLIGVAMGKLDLWSALWLLIGLNVGVLVGSIAERYRPARQTLAAAPPHWRRRSSAETGIARY